MAVIVSEKFHEAKPLDQNISDARMSLAKTPISRLLVCGIGNSGSEYLHTRHSIGRLMTDYLRDHFDYPVWVKDKSVSGFWSEKRENLILFKTGGFMNNAGRSVAAAYRKIRLGNTSRVLVIHDDLELPVGQVKLRTIGRGKGHNGILSCVSCLQTEAFLRISVGIGRPESRDSIDVSKYVLSPVPASEGKIFRQHSFPGIVEIIHQLVDLKTR